MTDIEDGFTDLINQVVDGKMMTPEEIAYECSTAISTVKRWMAGESRPAPMVRDKVYELIFVKLEERIAKLSELGELND